MITIERFWWFVKSVRVASFFQSFAPDNIATLQQACLLYCQCGLRWTRRCGSCQRTAMWWWKRMNSSRTHNEEKWYGQGGVNNSRGKCFDLMVGLVYTGDGVLLLIPLYWYHIVPI
jgi:hypothetical protein